MAPKTCRCGEVMGWVTRGQGAWTCPHCDSVCKAANCWKCEQYRRRTH